MLFLPTKKSRKTQWKINQPSDVFFENPVGQSGHEDIDSTGSVTEGCLLVELA